MVPRSPSAPHLPLRCLFIAFLLLSCNFLPTQNPLSAPATQQPAAGSVAGTITDTDHAAVPGARVVLENLATRSATPLASDVDGSFLFPSVPPGSYLVTVAAKGFASWKIKGVVVVREGESRHPPAG